MFRIYFALAAAVAALAVVVAPAGAAIPALKGTVGPGFTITLKKGATKVAKLKAGKYKLVINDLSDIHNFHLFGPGVNKRTSVGAESTVTWTVTLKKGTYRYVCDPHATSMKGAFKVT